MLAAVMACSYIDRSVLTILIPDIKQEFLLTDTDLGLLGGLSFAVLFVAAGVPIARLAERINRVNIITASIAIWSVMTALSGIAGSFATLLIARIGVGIGEAGAAPSALSIVSDYFPPHRRATAISCLSLGIAAGTVLGTAIGGMVAEAYNWRAAFFVVGVPGLMFALLFRISVHEPPRGALDPVPQSVTAKPEPFRQALGVLARSSTYRHIVVGAAVGNITFQGIGLFSQSYFARRFNVGLGEIGLMTGLLGGGALGIGTFLGGVISDWLGMRSARWYALTPMGGLLLSTPTFLLLYSSQSWTSTLVLLPLPMFFFSAVIAPMAAITQNLVAPRMRATAYALLTTVTSLIGVGFGPVIAGLLSDAFLHAELSHAAPALTAACLHKIHGPATATACGIFSANALQDSLLMLSLLPLWAAFHYWRAAKSAAKELKLD